MKKLDKLTFALVALLAGLAFVLSYNALRLVAISAGVPFALAFFWPLCIDAFMVALAVFRVRRALASINDWETRRLTSLVFVFSLVSVGFNMIEAQASALSIAVFALPPVVLFAAVELLSAQLESAAQLDTAQTSLAELLRQVTFARDELADVQSEVATMEQREKELTAAHQERIDALLPVDIIALDAWRNDPHAKQTSIAQQAGVKRQYISQRKAHLELIGAIHENGDGVEVLV